MNTSSFRVVPIPSKVAHLVCETMHAPGYGHPAHRDMATGYGPCRLCLRPFREGEEERILFTYDPFWGYESEPLPGPIFVHAEACEPYIAEGYPDELRFIPLTLNAYGRGRRVIHQLHVSEERVETIIDELFADTRVDYVHIRNTEAGCFIALAIPTTGEIATIIASQGR